MNNVNQCKSAVRETRPLHLRTSPGHVAEERQYPNKINVFIEAKGSLGNNARAVLSQQRNFG